MFRPTKREIGAAKNRTVPDIIGPGLTVLFCGINPSLYSAAVGHHFARPGNRFWRTLYEAGFTPRLLSPEEDRTLLQYGCGIVNLADRPTTAADEISQEELAAGRDALEKKVRRYRPKALAVLGIGAYRSAFNRPQAQVGRQAETIAETRVWVLPNPSGLNANYHLNDLVRLFKTLRQSYDG